MRLADTIVAGENEGADDEDADDSGSCCCGCVGVESTGNCRRRCDNSGVEDVPSAPDTAAAGDTAEVGVAATAGSRPALALKLTPTRVS